MVLITWIQVNIETYNIDTKMFPFCCQFSILTWNVTGFQGTVTFMESFSEMHHKSSKDWINWKRKKSNYEAWWPRMCFQMPIVRDKILGDYNIID